MTYFGRHLLYSYLILDTFFKEEVFQKEKEQKMHQHIGQYFPRHVFQNHLHAYLPVGKTTQFIYFSICTTIESLNESLKMMKNPHPRLLIIARTTRTVINNNG